MISTLLFHTDKTIQSGEEELIAVWQKKTDARLWIDIQFDSQLEAKQVLEQFHLHPLAIEDALRTRHPPKIEFFDDYVLILYRGIVSINGSLDFTHQQICMFVAENFIISLHPKRSLGVSKMQQQISDTPFTSPLHIAIGIMRFASYFYLENILEFENRLSDLEDELQQQGNDKLLAELTAYKSKLLKIIRSFNYNHTITRALQQESDQYPYLSYDTHEHVINDLDDRFDRLSSLSKMHYDICGDLVDGYLSISAHQLNVTMRVLTVITAIFVPLGFLAGLYGMNFEYMPELKQPFGYFFLLGTMSLIAVLLLVFFKKKHWL